MTNIANAIAGLHFHAHALAAELCAVDAPAEALAYYERKAAASALRHANTRLIPWDARVDALGVSGSLRGVPADAEEQLAAIREGMARCAQQFRPRVRRLAELGF